jgi:hypothetical protein
VCRWEVEDYRNYRIYHSGRIADAKPRCLLLLQVDGTGHAGEGFRFSLEGDQLEADIWTSDVFAAADLGGFRLRLETKVEMVDIRPNTLSSRWEDIITLLGKGSLIAFRPDAAEDCSAEFKQAYADALLDNPLLGAAIRWSVQAKNTTNMHLVLQCLPSTADRLRADPRLTADDGPSIQIETMELDTEILIGDPGPGPVPILFARDPRETRITLGEHPGNILTGKRSLREVHGI